MKNYVYLVLRLNGESYDVISIVSSLPKAKKSAKTFLSVKEKRNETIVWTRVKIRNICGFVWFGDLAGGFVWFGDLAGDLINEVGPTVEISKVEIDNPLFFSFVKEEK